MEPLEGNQALLDGEGPLEHDGPYIARVRDRATRLELGRGDPAVLIPHPAEQRHVRLPHHGHAPNLDRVLVLHRRSPSGVRAEHTWQRERTLPSSRCEAENGLAARSTPDHLPASN